jgi:hypothetical protein
MFFTVYITTTTIYCDNNNNEGLGIRETRYREAGRRGRDYLLRQQRQRGIGNQGDEGDEGESGRLGRGQGLETQMCLELQVRFLNIFFHY